MKLKYCLIILLAFCFNQSRDTIPVEANSLRVLSWNIKMFPAPYGWFQNRKHRAENIIEALKESELYDVILFQEAFSGKIRKIIFNGLKTIYPNQITPKDQTIFYKTNSGLWVISRTPITLIDEISFSQLRNWDTFSSKGAKLYSVTKNKQEFYLINTHLQSDYEKEYRDVRSSQYSEINDGLILPNLKSGLPIFLCGDLNISKSPQLNALLDKLKFENGPLSGKILYSALGDKKLVDYILVKLEDFKIKSVERKIQEFSSKLLVNPFYYSDHYAIEMEIIW